MKLWTIYRNGAYAGTIRAKTKDAAIREYAAWAKCPAGELSATT